MIAICPCCKNEIDLETCCCGDVISEHPYEVGHSFVPMGCICGYSKENKKDDSIRSDKKEK